MKPSTKPRKSILIFICFLTWFSSAFIFVQIPALSQEIKIEIFPSTDVTTSILMVTITLSVSLIARFLGGIVLGSYTNTKGIQISIYSIIILAILTGLQISLILIVKLIDNLFLVSAIFLVIRFLIGFFIGGIWPNLGIFALEEYYRKNDGPKNDEDFRKKVQGYGWISAVIQTGLTFSFFIESVIILVIAIHSDKLGQFLGNWVPSVNLLSTQFTSFIGFILLLFVFVYWFRYTHSNKNKHDEYSSDYDEYYSDFLYLRSKYNSLRDLLINKKYRFTLLNLWLIITGLMYMYYSTVIITPELLYRISLPPSFQGEYIRIVIAVSSLIGHVFLGFFYLRKKDNEENKDKENNDFCLIEKMSKIIIIVVVIVICLSFVIYYTGYENNTTAIYTMIVVQIVLAFLANSPWALIPSILTSRFPKHFRFLAGSLAYNGGLVFSFASPFLLQQVIISSQYDFIQSYLFGLIPMLLGGLSIWLGSRQLINDFLPMSIKGKMPFGYFEIRIPSEWNKFDIISYSSNFIPKGTQINEYKLFNLEKWIMSIFFIKNKNNQKFLDYEILPLLRELIYIKMGEDKEEFTSISESEEEEVYINSTLAKKILFYIQGNKENLSTLIIPYSNSTYLILYRDNQDNRKDNDQMSKVLNTFDIKIPLKKQ